MYFVCVFSPVLIPFIAFLTPYYYLHHLWSTSFMMSVAFRCAGSWAVSTFLCWTGRRGSLLSATSPTTTLRPWAFTMGGVFRFYHQHNITRQACVAKTTQPTSPTLGFHDGLHDHQHDQTWNLSKLLHDQILRPKILHTLKMPKSRLLLITIKQHKFQYPWFWSFLLFKKKWRCKI